MDPRQRYIEGRRIVLAGVIVNVALTLMKIVGGITGRSQALVADGFHSLSDLATDIVAYLGLRYSSKPRDADHPYGHGKIETLATTFVGLLLLMTGVLLAYWGAVSAFEGGGEEPGVVALFVAVVSIIFKEGIYRFTLTYARRLDSSVLVANAWHHRSDALSSLAALIGIAGAKLGLPFLDPLAAVAVAIMIIRVGVQVVIQGARELVEESLHAEAVDHLVGTARAVDGVQDVSGMYTRKVGTGIVIDISITVDGGLTVTRGHEIAHGVESALIGSGPTVELVTVHVEPHGLDAPAIMAAIGVESRQPVPAENPDVDA
jgi:cation diffusion facilitator family transporter